MCGVSGEHVYMILDSNVFKPNTLRTIKTLTFYTCVMILDEWDVARRGI